MLAIVITNIHFWISPAPIMIAATQKSRNQCFLMKCYLWINITCSSDIMNNKYNSIYIKILGKYYCTKTWAVFKMSHLKLIRRGIRYLPSLEISDSASTHCLNARTQIVTTHWPGVLTPFQLGERGWGLTQGSQRRWGQRGGDKGGHGGKGLEGGSWHGVQPGRQQRPHRL